LKAKRAVLSAIAAFSGVFLIWDGVNAWMYTGSMNFGTVASWLLGLFLLACAIKTAFVHKPLIRNRRARVVLRCIMLLCIAVFAAIECLIIADPYIHSAESAGKADYLLVLGCRIWPDGSPTLALSNRLDRAVEYYYRHPDVKIIVSGGQGTDEPMPEAEAMAKYLEKKGIPETSIIKETRSASTMENFRFSRALLPEGAKEPVKLVFVTNDFHVFRARILAERNGFEAYGIPAPTPSVILVNSYLREFFAFVKSMLVDY